MRESIVSAKMPKEEDPTGQEQNSNQATLRAASTNRSRESTGSVNSNGSKTDSDSRASVASGLRQSDSGKHQKNQSNQHKPYSTGRDMSGRPIFTLAGPSFQDGGSSERSQNQHQPYVQAGYAELNPAYDQPGNIRPIWGLADPMPRTVRPGTKPSDQEIQSGRPREDVLQPTDSQMEQGNGLRLGLSKITKNIHDATNDRERKHTERYGQSHHDLSGDDNEKEDEEIDDEDIEATRDQGEEDHIPLSNIREELHNHHTLWAVFRTKLREPLAEVLAVSLTDCLTLSRSLINVGVCFDDDWYLCQYSTQAHPKRLQRFDGMVVGIRDDDWYLH
jgi:hypothetical protein